MKKVQDMKLFSLLAFLVAISFGCSSNDASNPTNGDPGSGGTAGSLTGNGGSDGQSTQGGDGGQSDTMGGQTGGGGDSMNTGGTGGNAGTGGTAGSSNDNTGGNSTAADAGMPGGNTGNAGEGGQIASDAGMPTPDMARPIDDSDRDGVANAVDNCPDIPNPDQANTDGDLFGDACDSPSMDNDGDAGTTGGEPVDTDGDFIYDDEDNCPSVPNGPEDLSEQGDADGDGVGDCCDDDFTDENGVCPNRDGDAGNENLGVLTICALLNDDGTTIDDEDGLDYNDNCPCVSNPDQTDVDGDGVGDACDNCPFLENPNQEDSDRDSCGDACDNCPALENPPMNAFGVAVSCSIENLQLDEDNNDVGDACEGTNPLDPDDDGFLGEADTCPLIANIGDADNDGIDDACDSCPGIANIGDTDEDGIDDVCDNCLGARNPDQADTEVDANGVVIGDGVGNLCDNCPTMVNTSQANIDGDQLGNICDPCPTIADSENCEMVGMADMDGDGAIDDIDECPFDCEIQTLGPGQVCGEPNDACGGTGGEAGNGGIIQDQDGDGVADADDECPTNCEFSIIPDGGCGEDKLDCSGTGGDETGCILGDGSPDANCDGAPDSDEGTADPDTGGAGGDGGDGGTQMVGCPDLPNTIDCGGNCPCDEDLCPIDPASMPGRIAAGESIDCNCNGDLTDDDTTNNICNF